MLQQFSIVFGRYIYGCSLFLQILLVIFSQSHFCNPNNLFCLRYTYNTFRLEFLLLPVSFSGPNLLANAYVSLSALLCVCFPSTTFDFPVATYLFRLSNSVPHLSL